MIKRTTRIPLTYVFLCLIHVPFDCFCIAVGPPNAAQTGDGYEQATEWYLSTRISQGHIAEQQSDSALAC